MDPFETHPRIWRLPQDAEELESLYIGRLPPRDTVIVYGSSYPPSRELVDVGPYLARKENAAVDWHDWMAHVVPKHLARQANAPWTSQGNLRHDRTYLALSRLSSYLAGALRTASTSELLCIAKILNESRRAQMQTDLHHVLAMLQSHFDTVRDSSGCATAEARRSAQRELQEYKTSALQTVLTPQPQSGDLLDIAYEVAAAGLAELSPVLLPGFLFRYAEIWDPVHKNSKRAFRAVWNTPFASTMMRDAYRALYPFHAESLNPITTGLIAYVALMVSLALDPSPYQALETFCHSPIFSLHRQRYLAWLDSLQNHGDAEALTTKLWAFWDEEAAKLFPNPIRAVPERWELDVDRGAHELDCSRDQMEPPYDELLRRRKAESESQPRRRRHSVVRLRPPPGVSPQ